MKFVALLAALVLAGCVSPQAPTAPVKSPQAQAPAGQPSALNGTWDVTLYWSPTEPPSSTVMVLDIDGEGALTGSFYDSDFIEAEYSLRNETLAFGAITTDDSSLYSHSGRLVNGQIEGQTLSHGRDFLMIWVATRRAAPASG